MALLLLVHWHLLHARPSPKHFTCISFNNDGNPTNKELSPHLCMKGPEHREARYPGCYNRWTGICTQEHPTSGTVCEAKQCASCPNRGCRGWRDERTFITRGNQKKLEVIVEDGWRMRIVSPRCGKKHKWSWGWWKRKISVKWQKVWSAASGAGAVPRQQGYICVRKPTWVEDLARRKGTERSLRSQ